MKIYRCGWCGFPTNKDGDPLEVDPDKYLEQHQNDEVVNVQGACCPNGEDAGNEMVQVTRDMAIDAGMPELEGQWINWS